MRFPHFICLWNETTKKLSFSQRELQMKTSSSLSPCSLSHSLKCHHKNAWNSWWSLPPNRVISIYSCITSPAPSHAPVSLTRHKNLFWYSNVIFGATFVEFFPRKENVWKAEVFSLLSACCCCWKVAAWETLWATTATTTRLKVLAKLFGFYCQNGNRKRVVKGLREQRVESRAENILNLMCPLAVDLFKGFPDCCQGAWQVGG